MEEKRVHRRFPLHWRAALRHNEQAAVVYGETADVSLGGASVLVEQNFPHGTSIFLYLQRPPKRHGDTPTVIESLAKVQYSAFSAAHDRWRLGIQFLNFVGESKKIP